MELLQIGCCRNSLRLTFRQYTQDRLMTVLGSPDPFEEDELYQEAIIDAEMLIPEVKEAIFGFLIDLFITGRKDHKGRYYRDCLQSEFNDLKEQYKRAFEICSKHALLTFEHSHSSYNGTRYIKIRLKHLELQDEDVHQ